MTALGANLHPGGGLTFAVWAPRVDRLGLEILPGEWGSPKRFVDLERDGEIWRGELEGVRDGDLYELVLADGRRRPDPRSRRQPEGVHGPSAVVDPAVLAVRPRPAQPPLHEWVIYELHPGTFTPAGTLDAAVQALPYLQDVGVTAVELMPVSCFPGSRNWGYDGVAPFAVQESYGGPAALARFVNAAHDLGLAVILDVVYNHLGPEGNYLRELAPYFTARHVTPWGEAVDFGNPHVRRWAIDSALQWATAFQIDGLRLDAIHAIFDDSPHHVLAELAAAVQPGCAVISESDLNDPVTVIPRERGGWGHDAQWSDDLHHALHALLTGERGGYYQDFGEPHHVKLALDRGFIYDGSLPSAHRGGKRHGKSTAGIPAERHVVCLQNHDQVGNRARGDRIAHLVGTGAAKVGAATVLLAPGIPLLFMGEEYAARQPFPYFTSHGDPELGRAVTEGRRREFASFAWQGEVPDPQDPATFATAVLQLEERTRPGHRGMLAWYRRLLALRRDHPALRGEGRGERTRVLADDPGRTIVVERTSAEGPAVLAVLAFGTGTALVRPRVEQTWKLILDSGSEDFEGPGAAAPPELRPGDALRPVAPAAWIYGR